VYVFVVGFVVDTDNNATRDASKIYFDAPWVVINVHCVACEEDNRRHNPVVVD